MPLSIASISERFAVPCYCQVQAPIQTDEELHVQGSIADTETELDKVSRVSQVQHLQFDTQPEFAHIIWSYPPEYLQDSIAEAPPIHNLNLHPANSIQSSPSIAAQGPRITTAMATKPPTAQVQPCRYKTGKTLGAGSYSVVKECVHIDTGRYYAAKVINKRLMAGREHMVRNEIAVLKKVSMGHQNILTLVDYFETMNNRTSFYSSTKNTRLIRSSISCDRSRSWRRTLRSNLP